EQEDRVAVEARRPAVVEDGRRPVDPAGQPVLERDVRPRCLEVEEAFGINLGKALRVPHFGEVSGRERGALAAVVPAAECCDENGVLEPGTARDGELLGNT